MLAGELLARVFMDLQGFTYGFTGFSGETRVIVVG